MDFDIVYPEVTVSTSYDLAVSQTYIEFSFVNKSKSEMTDSPVSRIYVESEFHRLLRYIKETFGKHQDKFAYIDAPYTGNTRSRINQLISLGLIERCTDPSNKSHFVLTETGESALDVLEQLLVEYDNVWTKVLYEKPLFLRNALSKQTDGQLTCYKLWFIISALHYAINYEEKKHWVQVDRRRMYEEFVEKYRTTLWPEIVELLLSDSVSYNVFEVNSDILDRLVYCCNFFDYKRNEFKRYLVAKRLSMQVA